jgi:hypothetical protein
VLQRVKFTFKFEPPSGDLVAVLVAENALRLLVLLGADEIDQKAAEHFVSVVATISSDWRLLCCRQAGVAHQFGKAIWVAVEGATADWRSMRRRGVVAGHDPLALPYRIYITPFIQFP